MDSWQDIQKEIIQAGAKIGLPADFDAVRRASYKALSDLTGRPLLIYASAFHVPGKSQIAGGMLSIDLADKEGFQEILRDIDGAAVDVFVHSPGGSAEATESVVKMLRAKFSDIRFIVTGSAKSAATMLVLSGNSILMTNAAELGPTDPQEILGTGRPSPAGAILDQFARIQKEIAADPSTIGSWLPILQQCGPSLFQECENHIELSNQLVTRWLEDYMFSGDQEAHAKAAIIAEYLADHKNFLSHGRRVDALMLREKGVKVELVDSLSPEIARAIIRVHLSIMATLDGTGAVKLFENSSGSALIRQVIQQQIPFPLVGGIPRGGQAGIVGIQ